jgi:serine/threonine protein kinase
MYDPAVSDVWSLGVTLFNMVTGYLPYKSMNIRELYTQILTTKAVLPEWLS